MLKLRSNPGPFYLEDGSNFWGALRWRRVPGGRTFRFEIFGSKAFGGRGWAIGTFEEKMTVFWRWGWEIGKSRIIFEKQSVIAIIPNQSIIQFHLLQTNKKSIQSFKLVYLLRSDNCSSPNHPNIGSSLSSSSSSLRRRRRCPSNTSTTTSTTSSPCTLLLWLLLRRRLLLLLLLRLKRRLLLLRLRLLSLLLMAQLGSGDDHLLLKPRLLLGSGGDDRLRRLLLLLASVDDDLLQSLVLLLQLNLGRNDRKISSRLVVPEPSVLKPWRNSERVATSSWRLPLRRRRRRLHSWSLSSNSCASGLRNNCRNGRTSNATASQPLVLVPEPGESGLNQTAKASESRRAATRPHSLGQPEDESASSCNAHPGCVALHVGQAAVPEAEAANAHDRHGHTKSRPVEAGRVVLADESVGAVVGGWGHADRVHLLPEVPKRTWRTASLLHLAVELLRGVGGAREDLAPISRSIGLDGAGERPGGSQTVLQVIDLASVCSTRFLRNCAVLVELESHG